jgi:hypothetical protein
MGRNVFALITDRTVINSKSDGAVRWPQHVILAVNSIVVPKALTGRHPPREWFPASSCLPAEQNSRYEQKA